MAVLRAEARHFNTPVSPSDHTLPASITRAASKQTYYTVRVLVDRGRVTDAFRAYGYFRWVDDQLDGDDLTPRQRLAFVKRQQGIMECAYRGEAIPVFSEEERMLTALIHSDHEKNSGLQAYIRNMMAVMAFDTGRRGQLITHEELTRYTRSLSIAVTEALHYFIGHGMFAPRGEFRYLAAAGAHITHMLRDTLEDAEAGYFNIPREIVERHGIDPFATRSDPYRAWVRSQVLLAKEYFRAGREYLARVESFRCRLAGYAYIARFEGTLEAIESEGYILQASYPERKTSGAAIYIASSVLGSSLTRRRARSWSPAFPSKGWQL